MGGYRYFGHVQNRWLSTCGGKRKETPCPSFLFLVCFIVSAACAKSCEVRLQVQAKPSLVRLFKNILVCDCPRKIDYVSPVDEIIDIGLRSESFNRERFKREFHSWLHYSVSRF